MDNSICIFCSKEFSSKYSLLSHQKTVKSCLKLQGKEDIEIGCENCNKILSIRSYKKHKYRCDEKYKKEKEKEKEKEDVKKRDKEIKELDNIINNYKLEIEKYKLDINNYKSSILLIEKEKNFVIKTLEKHIQNLQSTSTSISMKLAEKNSTINVNNKMLIINNNPPLTNQVLNAISL